MKGLARHTLISYTTRRTKIGRTKVWFPFSPKWTLTAWRLRKGHHPLPERELSRYDHLS